MKRLKLVTLLATGIIALSPVATTFTSTTNTVLATKTKKAKKRTKRTRKTTRRKKRSVSNDYYTEGYKKPFRTVYIDIPQSDELYQKTLEAMQAWNNTGAFTFKQIQNKSKANIVVSEYNTGHIYDENYVPDDPKGGYTVPLASDMIRRSNKYYFSKSHIYLNQYMIHWAAGRSSDMKKVTIEHEFGHAIGLKHSKNEDSLMYWMADQEIQPMDVKAVKKLYHEK